MKNKKRVQLIIMTVICGLSLLMMSAALLKKTEPVRGEFVPPPFEKEAESGTPEVPDGLGWGEIDAQAFVFSVCGKIVVEDSCADIWLTNSSENNVWLKGRILDEQGNILAETGLLKPGEYVQSIEFEKVPGDGTAIGIKLMSYEPETYYSAGSAVLNTTAEVKK